MVVKYRERLKRNWDVNFFILTFILTTYNKEVN